MAKLYWRVKKDGKWTWSAAKVVDVVRDDLSLHVTIHLEDEQ